MTVAGSQIADATAARDAAQDWQAVRRAADIQFSPLAPAKAPEAPEVPEWLQAIGRALAAVGRALEAVLAPLGRWLGMSWPTFKWVLVGLAVLLFAFLLWNVLKPVIERWRARPRAEGEASWTPSRAEAESLLADADRLAALGRYGEAAHLLLRRSVGHISSARPEWLVPASTAREIAVLPMLPESGRAAFGQIAERVERSLYALRDLDAADWAVARAAYADFARLELNA